MKKPDILSTLENVWVVKFRENKDGLDGDTWTHWYDSYEKALEIQKIMNSRNENTNVMDYYICASKPIKFIDYYNIDR